MADIIPTAAVLVQSASRIAPSTMSYPVVAPSIGHVAADVVGTFLFPADQNFSLILTGEIVEVVLAALGDQNGLGWDFETRDRFAARLDGIAALSGGGFVEPLRDLDVPAGLGVATDQALRCAVSPDLGTDRVAVVVTDDPAIRPGPWHPQLPGWSGEGTISVMRPGVYVSQVERARLRLRQTRR